MRLNFWTEIRTAAHVARFRRVSQAAEVLGMHHSSVIRQIDQLEDRLKTKLFQRTPRGYIPTEAGEQLLQTATSVDDQLTHMLNQIESNRDEITGSLIITAVPLIDQQVLPAIAEFQRDHPSLKVSYRSDERTYDLSNGETHIALRAGPAPTDADYVVTPLADYRVRMFASKSYIATRGRPDSIDDLAGHRFVNGEGRFARAGFHRWLTERVPEENYVLSTPQSSVAYWAIVHGLGIGFINAGQDATELVDLFPELNPPEWTIKMWVVSHVDLYRTKKVRTFSRFIQEKSAVWS
ncbi:MAG: LysR family transcriptional regulator [Paracoccus denitrificans]|nr:MAG: LysR family transcriptional regulator [Paracoccus denitrificans]PZO83822.1 MAG: LysR family transcriptional regulator [Paracoccus denitrificans]